MVIVSNTAEASELGLRETRFVLIIFLIIYSFGIVTLV